LLSKHVQEMVQNGEEPPPPYKILINKYTQNVPSASCSLPIIDFGLLSSPTKQKQELQRLRSALSCWGCFVAINYGTSSSLLDKVRQVAREFFEQPMEQKKIISKGVEEFEGYGADPVPEEGQSLDWSDRLFLDVSEDTRKPSLWPENPSSLRDAVEEYSAKMREATNLISKAIAKSLDLEENCFLNQFGEQALLQVRFNYYPFYGSGYIIILQDDVERLQVHHDGKWFTISTISHALLVLMGDQMDIMTNGIFKSPVHRVLANSKRERISVAMFYTPEPNKEIGPEQSLVNEEQPRYYADTHWKYYQRGMRAIHVAKDITVVARLLESRALNKIKPIDAN
ncbi:hypothetical protein AAZX31_13G347800, partial [Glycine max]